MFSIPFKFSEYWTNVTMFNFRYPDPSIRENNMLPPHKSQPQSHAQRPSNMNGAPNPKRTSVNMAAMNLSSQVSVSMVPRSVNANVGGPSQSAQIRHQPPPAQQQGQMITRITQNRQPPQSQTLTLSQLQKFSQVTVKKQNRKSFHFVHVLILFLCKMLLQFVLSRIC